MNLSIKLHFFPKSGGRDSAASIWTRYALDGDRIPVVAIFSMLIQTDAKAHPVCSTVAAGSFPREKWPSCDANHTPTSSAEVVNGLELYLCLPYNPA